MIKVNYDKETGKVIGFNRNTEPYIEITEEERHQPLKNKYQYYAVVNNKFTILEREPSAEEMSRDIINSKTARIKEIEKWFSDNDWRFNKVFLGEWKTTDPRWTEYLTQRSAMRQEHEELTEVLKIWQDA